MKKPKYMVQMFKGDNEHLRDIRKCFYCGGCLKAEDHFADLKKIGGKLTRKETITWNKTVKQISPDIQNYLNQIHKGC